MRFETAILASFFFMAFSALRSPAATSPLYVPALVFEKKKKTTLIFPGRAGGHVGREEPSWVFVCWPGSWVEVAVFLQLKVRVHGTSEFLLSLCVLAT